MTDASHPARTADDPAPLAPATDAQAVIAIAQLWADQFQHMTTLAVAAAGGLLLVVQTGVVTVQQRWWHAFVLFVLCAVFSFAGQTAVVDDATRGTPPGRRARILRGLGAVALGAGGGAAFRLLAA